MPKMHVLFSLNLFFFPRKGQNVVSTRKSRQQTGLKAIYLYLYLYLYIYI